MQTTAVGNLPLTKNEIEDARAYLHESLLPVSDPERSRPYEEVFAEVRENAKF